MTIKELEERLDLPRTSIRYYEQEGLLHPERGANNYRDYTEEDVRTLEKVKLLRQLHLEGRIQEGELTLAAALERQLGALAADQTALERSRRVCQALWAEQESYAALDPRPWLQELERDAPLPAPHFPQPRETQKPPSVAPNPFRRYAARFLDLSLCTLPFVLAELLSHTLLTDNLVVTWLRNVLAMLLLILVEPLLLHTWGYTPGKWCLGLKIRDRNGEKLTIRRARRRCWQLFGKGQGYFIPIYDLVRQWKSYRACRDGEPLPWDSDNALPVEDDLSYEAEELRLAKGAAWAVSVLLVFGLVALAVVYAILPPCRGELTVAELARNYNYCAQRLELNVPELDKTGEADPMWIEAFDGAMGWYPPNLTLETDDAGNVTGFTITWVSRPDANLYSVPSQDMATTLSAAFLGARGGWQVVHYIQDVVQVSNELAAMPLEGTISLGNLNLERTLEVQMGELRCICVESAYYESVGAEPVHALLTLTGRLL